MDAIVVKNLRKEYAGFTLRDCSLTLPAGCVMGLIGENVPRYEQKTLPIT